MRKILFTLTICFFIIGIKAQVQLYGLTYSGGSSGTGTIFHYTISTATHTLDYSMEESWVNGVYPQGSGLTLSNGKFYGMTTFGGASQVGVIFEWNPVTNIYIKKIDFDCINGCYPYGALVFKSGKFYGTAGGGTNGSGVIFEWDPVTNIYTKKIDFGDINGAYPYGALVLKSGKFYGMTGGGGTNGSGVIFEWDPVTNIYTKKIDFGGINGTYPYGSLTLSLNKFYGMTFSGGANDYGVIFEWDPATNVYTKKVDFNSTNGANPYGSLTLSSDKFYGMTSEGGIGYGVIFEWDPGTNTYTKKIDFDYTAKGAFPHGSLTISGGKFYGMTFRGGVNVPGVIFEWNPSTNTYIKLIDFNGSNGSSPVGNLVEYNPTPIPAISITDKSVTEGNSGTTEMNFKAILNTASISQVTVNYATVNGTATSGSDYIAANGTLSFSPGQTDKTIKVRINGDTQNEPTEKFKVTLSQPVNATIADSIGIGKIKNDDPAAFATNNNLSDISKENGAVSLSLQVAPNPAKNKITVSGLATGAANYMEFTDLNGRSLLKRKIATPTETINLSGYAQGIYILRYYNGSNWQQIKVVKQ